MDAADPSACGTSTALTGASAADSGSALTDSVFSPFAGDEEEAEDWL